MAPVHGGLAATLEMAAAADTAARQARARYQSSLQALRSALAAFPAIKRELGAHEVRLDELEQRVAGLRVEIADFVSSAKSQSKETAAFSPSNELSEQASLPCAPSKTGVSFNADACLAEVYNYDQPEFDEHIPEHGHWLPNAITGRRASFDEATEFAKQLSGRMLSFTTEGDSEPNTCVLVEPMGKILSPNEYVSAGVVICVLGAESAEASAAEWSRVLKQTQWLDAGLSVALPNLQPGCGMEREILEAAIRHVLALVGVSRCLLIGKDWGAELALSVAASGRYSAELAGIVLFAPGSLVEDACGRLNTPAFVLWARDDEVSPFSDGRSWAEAMSRWPAATCFKEASSGGHDMAKVLDGSSELAPSLVHFCSTAFLMAELRKLATEIDEGASAEVEEDGDGRLSECALRLAYELPAYLVSLLSDGSRMPEEHGVALVLAQLSSGRSASRALRRAASQLQEWINCGLEQVASATE
eukprot:TRINITY_DN50061_c0_g1_i1.p1 TRINITY_DN50061_c0_g1~~TRINITY_DN50061_c0_g1_i1.p1  ORF type:complete len:475 (-),score=70.03 TRINITY_DN50061_c0_g1_i1:124-1548(-)